MRVASWKQFPRRGLRHDGHQRCIRRVTFAEIATRDQGNPQRLEKPGRDRLREPERTRCQRRRAFRDRIGRARVRAAERNVLRQDGPPHPGDFRQCGRRAQPEAALSLRRGIRRRRQIEPGDEDVPGVKAGGLAAKMQEAHDQHGCADDQHQRHRDLPRHDQPARAVRTDRTGYRAPAVAKRRTTMSVREPRSAGYAPMSRPAASATTAVPIEHRHS